MVKRLKPRRGDSPDTIRYAAPTRKRTLALPMGGSANAIDRHITKHLGKPAYVLHEILSELVHIDVHVVEPTKSRPFWFLATSGMSDLPMHVPRGAESLRYAEVALALPKWWKLDEASLKSNRWYWPVHWLKAIARFPHEFETWVSYFHTIPLTDVCKPVGAKFDGVLLWQESEFPDKFYKCRIGKRNVVYLIPIPVYKEEMAYRLAHGSEALLDKLATLGSVDWYDPQRPNSCGKIMKKRSAAPRTKTARGSAKR